MGRLAVEHLTEVLLALARERSVDGALDHMVAGLATRLPAVVQVGVWLTTACCPKAGLPGQEGATCLELAASAGRGRAPSTWKTGDGDFRKIPHDEPLIGQVARRAEGQAFPHAGAWPGGRPPEWATRDGIAASIAQPLVYQGEVLGVLGVFTREPLGGCLDEGRSWLRLFADHAAATIANAHAFAEIQRLRQKLELENEYLREEVREAQAFGDIVGESSALRKCLEQIELVAPTDASVLILGESGTGKELIARAIHQHSRRRERPLIKVNCAAVPQELFESEFFGHVQGAFTGAQGDRRGRFELADGGTLFLDEVGEIPLELQGKLLRVIQEGNFERLGEEETRHVNVRIVAATNRDLPTEVEAGRFREDLYYRLSVFPIEMVPLRARPEDIPLLATHFLEQAARRLGCPHITLRKKHIRQLQEYSWPGNVRELQNVIERAAITARCGELRLELPTTERSILAPSPAAGTDPPAPDGKVLTLAELKELERRNLQAALERCAGKVAGPGGAAELLDVHPSTLGSRLKALGIARPRTLRTGRAQHDAQAGGRGR